ncbi:uncharacterized protein F5147DRAFT_694002 [Suillus discolor]|uniref:Uncharacterized protein n=1 Tax=Suillus discolor TaxID=1912936 RepID=A0A9P7JU86_9AGAM|nr:uncharacterized protein F5147DRAFT_694002 [Suillus discolor]KAG2108620.1 hypothetical protein F5147DRAFT_694002 [Suillus discolor]
MVHCATLCIAMCVCTMVGLHAYGSSFALRSNGTKAFSIRYANGIIPFGLNYATHMLIYY